MVLHFCPESCRAVQVLTTQINHSHINTQSKSGVKVTSPPSSAAESAPDHEVRSRSRESFVINPLRPSASTAVYFAKTLHPNVLSRVFSHPFDNRSFLRTSPTLQKTLIPKPPQLLLQPDEIAKPGMALDCYITKKYANIQWCSAPRGFKSPSRRNLPAIPQFQSHSISLS